MDMCRRTGSGKCLCDPSVIVFERFFFKNFLPQNPKFLTLHSNICSVFAACNALSAVHITLVNDHVTYLDIHTYVVDISIKNAII